MSARSLSDPLTGKPLPTRKQPGYYPGYTTLSQASAWDTATREKILARVHNIPPIRFFNENEVKLLQVIVDHLLPQEDRDAAARIPIVPQIDKRLFEGHIPGYRFAKMPADGEAYRLGFQAIEAMAQTSYAKPFLDLKWEEQEELLKSIHDSKPKDGASEIWSKMEVHRYWALLLQDCVEAYYAHPWAWDEIGFGGPAYPRGYMRLENGEPEPWEVEEKRYEWSAPPGTLSDGGAEIASHQDHPSHGQGGTH